MKNQKDKIEKMEKIYTNQELDRIKTELILAGSEEKYYLNKGAIIINDYGTWSVCQKYDGSIPYNELSRGIEALEKREARIKYYENQRIERETGVKVENPALERLKQSVRGLKIGV